MHVKTRGILVVKLLRLRVKSSASGRIDTQRRKGVQPWLPVGEVVDVYECFPRVVGDKKFVLVLID